MTKKCSVIFWTSENMAALPVQLSLAVAGE
jgi:hypothetical protein